MRFCSDDRENETLDYFPYAASAAAKDAKQAFALPSHVSIV